MAQHLAHYRELGRNVCHHLRKIGRRARVLHKEETEVDPETEETQTQMTRAGSRPGDQGTDHSEALSPPWQHGQAAFEPAGAEEQHPFLACR
jgi:hypothetical protein